MTDAAANFKTVRSEFGGVSSLDRNKLEDILKNIDSQHFTSATISNILEAAGLSNADPIKVDDLLGWVFGIDPKKVASAPIVVIAGPPAAGKGTQCEKIKEKYGYVHISTGDILRENVKDGTELGLKAKGYMDSGALVPSELIVDLVKDRLTKDDVKARGCLLDGFPRAPDQAEAMVKAGLQVQKFLLIEVPDDTLVERGCGRRLDPETGDIYHLKFKPPPEEIVDRLVHRSDDQEDKIRARLEAYHSQIDGILPFFKDVVVKIDGTTKPEVVFSKATASLDTL